MLLLCVTFLVESIYRVVLRGRRYISLPSDIRRHFPKFRVLLAYTRYFVATANGVTKLKSIISGKGKNGPSLMYCRLDLAMLLWVLITKGYEECMKIMDLRHYLRWRQHRLLSPPRARMTRNEMDVLIRTNESEQTEHVYLELGESVVLL